MARLLVVDDDTRIRSLLEEYLSGRGHEVNLAANGQEGLEAAKDPRLDLMVLDLMMPGIDGIEVLRSLRAHSNLPVIILTARGDDFDRIVGLELGADDYLAKPFNPRELTARIDAVLRRSRPHPKVENELRAGPIVVNLDRRTVQIAEVPVELTTTEFEILRALLQASGRVIPREKLMARARGEDFAAFDRSIDVHISHLRRKLGDRVGRPVLIQTIRGVGYLIPSSPELP